MSVTFNAEGGFYVFNCPHCDCSIQVLRNEVNCAIFRHGVRKTSFQPLNPHESRAVCENLAATDALFGCGQPFRLIKDSTTGIVTSVEKCDWI